MLIEALFLPLIAGKLRGGEFKKLLFIEIKYWWLITIAGFIELSALLIRKKEITAYWHLIEQNILWIQIVTYSLLIVVVLFNIKEKGFTVILIGVFLNFTVIMMNQGRMPVDIRPVEHLMSDKFLYDLHSGKDLIHMVANESTRLWILADIIHIKKPYPSPKSISIGDLFLIVGLFRFIFKKMFREK